MFFLVCSAAYTGYSECNLDCVVVHGGGGGGGGGSGGSGGCTGGCYPWHIYTGAAFCNLYCTCTCGMAGAHDGGGGGCLLTIIYSATTIHAPVGVKLYNYAYAHSLNDSMSLLCVM